MADFNSAVSALQDLGQQPDVSVDVQGSTVRISVELREARRREEEQTIFTFVVDLDQTTGEYKLSQETTTLGSGPGSMSMRKTFGTQKTISFSKEWGQGGSPTSTFNSMDWEDQITQRVEACGWTRRKGFFSRLFGT